MRDECNKSKKEGKIKPDRFFILQTQNSMNLSVNVLSCMLDTSSLFFFSVLNYLLFVRNLSYVIIIIIVIIAEVLLRLLLYYSSSLESCVKEGKMRDDESEKDEDAWNIFHLSCVCPSRLSLSFVFYSFNYITRDPLRCSLDFCCSTFLLIFFSSSFYSF